MANLQNNQKFILKTTLFCLLVVLRFNVAAKQYETPELDSLTYRLTYLDESIEKVRLLNTLGEAYLNYDCNEAKAYANLAIEIAKKLNYPEGIIRSQFILANIHIYYTANYYKSLPHLSEALERSNKIGDKKNEVKALIKLAFVSKKNKDFFEAINYYDKSLKLARGLNDSDLSNTLTMNLGEVYLEQGDTLRAIQNLEKGYLYALSENFENTSPTSNYMIGLYFKVKGNSDEALYYFEEALNEFLDRHDQPSSALLYGELAEIYLDRNEVYNARVKALEGARIADEFNLDQAKIKNYGLLSITYNREGEYELSAKYLTKRLKLSDVLYEQRMAQQNEHFESSYEKIVNQSELEKLKKDKENNELRATNNELNRNFAIAAIFILIFLITLLIFRMRYKSRVAKKIAAQQEELAKLSIVASNISQMVMIVNADDKVEFVNKEYCSFNGYTSEEAIGKKISDLNSGQDTSRSTIAEINSAIFNKKEPIRRDILQYKKDGGAYWGRYHITPFLGANGNLEKYIVVGFDATQQKETEEEIKELSLVASSTDNSIIIFDKDVRAIWVNQGFIELTGLEVNEVIGKKPYEFNQSDALDPGYIDELEHQFRTNLPFTRESWAEAKNGDKYCLSMTVTPILDKNDDLERYISVGANITELKQLEEKYETIVEDSTDNITETDFGGFFTFVNTSTSKTTGYSKKELIGMHCSDLVREDFTEFVILFYRGQFEKQEKISYLEFPLITKDGREVWVGQNAKIKFNSDGKIDGVRNVSRDITEKKIAEEKLSVTLSNTQLLSEIGKQITATLSVYDIIDKVYDNINKLMDANIFGIGVHNYEKNTLDFPSIIEKGQRFDEIQFDLNDNSRLGVVCFKEQREVFIKNIYHEIEVYTSSNDVAEPKEGGQAMSIIYLPLVFNDHKIGVLTVQSFDENAYDNYHLNIARNIAVYVGIALENAGLYQDMEGKVLSRTKEVRKQKELIQMNLTNTKILSGIGFDVSSTFDFGDIFKSIHEKLCLMMDADVFGVRIFNEETGVITNKYEIRNGQLLPEKCSKIDAVLNFTTWCLTHRKEVLINDRRSEFAKYTGKEAIYNTGPLSMLYYPMIVDGKLTGLITVQSWKKAAYEPYHLDLLKSLASYIGSALDNAELYETLESKVAKRTEELNETNKDITASINYAKRIQGGILPSENFMKQLLPESFIVYRPRDIVSGDFYWMDRRDEKVIVAAVDCTGHGVPGAFISIIGRNLLDQAVNEKGLTKPAQILNFLQIGMMVTFGQMEGEDIGVYDGMDVTICAIDFKKMKLEFAGANNPLYIVRENELIIQKGDKMGISAQQNEGQFTNHEIPIVKDDMVLLFTDGFPDQFGGERNKKFTYRRMGEMFVKNSSLDSVEQGKLLEEAFDNWMEADDQTDDVCIIGFRV